MRTRLAFPLLALAVAATAVACTPGPTPTGGFDADTAASLNAQRADAGLGPLAWDGRLAGTAQQWADHLATIGTLVHEDLNGLLAGGLAGFASLRENLEQNYPSASGAAVVALWMGSPPHRANLLSPTVDAVGVGSAMDGAGRLFVVALFGAR